MDAQVIYDPQREVAALVDVETMRALGPIAVGANSEQELTQFARTMPETVLGIDRDTLTESWMEYWGREFQPLHEAAAEATDDQMEPPAGAGSDGENVASVATGAPSDEPPEPAPADADPEAGAPSPPQVVTCPACNGAKVVRATPADEPTPCNMCSETGFVTVNNAPQP